jgi:hypothetical protein
MLVKKKKEKKRKEKSVLIRKAERPNPEGSTTVG